MQSRDKCTKQEKDSLQENQIRLDLSVYKIKMNSSSLSSTYLIHFKIGALLVPSCLLEDFIPQKIPFFPFSKLVAALRENIEKPLSPLTSVGVGNELLLLEDLANHSPLNLLSILEVERIVSGSRSALSSWESLETSVVSIPLKTD